MCCKKFWMRIVPFALALMFGLLVVSVLRKGNEENIKPLDKIGYSGLRTATTSHCRNKSFETATDDKTLNNVPSETKPVNIISKPRASYTDAARQNQLQGTVRLRVTFMASGEIGSVSPIEELPDGLTEQAIFAARAIEFEPAIENGIPKTVTKQVQYNFIIY